MPNLQGEAAAEQFEAHVSRAMQHDEQGQQLAPRKAELWRDPLVDVLGEQKAWGQQQLVQLLERLADPAPGRLGYLGVLEDQKVVAVPRDATRVPGGGRRTVGQRIAAGVGGDVAIARPPLARAADEAPRRVGRWAGAEVGGRGFLVGRHVSDNTCLCDKHQVTCAHVAD